MREINKIITPAEILVRTLTMSRTVQKEIFEICRKSDEPTRQLIGRDTVYLAVRIVDNVLRVCRGDLERSKLVALTKNDITLLMSRVTLLIDEKRVELPVGVRVLKHLDTLEKVTVEECRNGRS